MKPRRSKKLRKDHARLYGSIPMLNQCDFCGNWYATGRAACPNCKAANIDAIHKRYCKED